MDDSRRMRNAEYELCWRSRTVPHSVLRTSRSARGLLLRKTVQRPESPDEIDGVYSDDGTIGEAIGEDVQRDAVIGIVERRDDHDAVGDVEVRVARGESLAVHDDRAGEGKVDDLEPPLDVTGRVLEPLPIVDGALVVLIGRIGLEGEDDRVASDEAGDVVHVAVRVVPDAALAEPDGGVDSQVLTEREFLPGPIEARVALLDRREQTLFGREENAIAVGLDRSTLEHETTTAVGANRLGCGNSRQPSNRRRDQRIGEVVVILGPRVEAPAYRLDASVVAPGERRARIAKPHTIAGYEMQAAPVEPNAMRP